jgi:hypothetical protein
MSHTLAGLHPALHPGLATAQSPFDVFDPRFFVGHASARGDIVAMAMGLVVMPLFGLLAELPLGDLVDWRFGGGDPGPWLAADRCEPARSLRSRARAPLDQTHLDRGAGIGRVRAQRAGRRIGSG